jgi:syntaxin 5
MDLGIRDRTEEFHKIVEKRRGEGLAARVVPQVAQSCENSEARRLFSDKAQQVGDEIATTTTKLAKLKKLAQSKSLFTDPAEEIRDLTYYIKTDIERINKDIEHLSHLQTQDAETSKQASKHTECILSSLKTDLMSATEDFKAVLQLRTENIEEQQKRREKYTAPTNSFATFSTEIRNRAAKKRATVDYFEQTPEERGDVAIEFESGSAGGPVLLTQDQFRQDRQESVLNIQRTIADLGTIFTQLATMVANQGETIERIDQNVDETMSNVEQGHTQLLKYFKAVSGNRALIIKIFLVLIATMIIAIIIAS